MPEAHSELAAVVQAWPKLSPHISVAILAIIQAITVRDRRSEV